MADEYLYGTYGIMAESVTQHADDAPTVPVYIGTLPVNLVRGYKQLVNKPVKLSNYTDAQGKVGYSPDWKKFTLCEAIEAHFNNVKGNIGPICVINVLNPDVHRVSNPISKSIAFTNGRAVIASDSIIIDTLALEDKTESVDYDVSYDFTGGKVVISSIGEPIAGNVAASWYEINVENITVSDIIGGKTEAGVYSGLAVIQTIYQLLGVTPALIAAPGWSDIPKVYKAMINAATKINGHWDAFVLADIPLTVQNIAAARQWKKDNEYISERSKVFWPQIMNGSGQKYHLSTFAVAELMRADSMHDGIPMETCGNKTISAVSQYFGDDSSNQGFDDTESRELTAAGISTAVYWAGNWVLWGDETAAYEYGTEFDARATFDVNIRMLFHITNSFQREWASAIDEPFTIQMKDTIINREQAKLDSLTAMGALYGNPTIQFMESKNSRADIRNGNFRWDIAVTPTPPMKSATAYVAYTDEGFTSMYE